jgi:tRNA (cytidine32/uridine32-2'-O)-methyltransferase
VQTLSYEIYKHSLIEQTQPKQDLFDKELPTAEELETFYSQLEKTLNETGFIIKKHPGQMMQRLRNVFSRAELDAREVRLLRGALASIARLKQD